MRQMTIHLTPAILRPGDTAPAAERLHRRIDPRLTRHRTSASVGRGRDIDYPRINLGDDLVAEAQPLDRAGPHVLYEYVALLNNLECDRAVRFFLQVELDHPLVMIRGDIENRAPLDH